MLNLTQEEWVSLTMYPPFAKFMTQLKRERDSISELIATGELLDANSAERTAINYATNTGRVLFINEILEYVPDHEEEDDERDTPDLS